MTQKQYIFLVTACVLASFAGSMVISWGVSRKVASPLSELEIRVEQLEMLHKPRMEPLGVCIV